VSGTRLFNDQLLALETQVGRRCMHGACTCACSRVERPIASEAECASLVALASELQPDVHAQGTHNLFLEMSAASGEMSATLLFVRLLERMRRAVATEYGVPLALLAPRQAFISRVTPVETDYSRNRNPIHVDESSVPGYHYSAVLYLSSSEEAIETGEGPQEHHFSGGGLHFYPSAHAQPANVLPRRGSVAIFSSGWENIHKVRPVTNGIRHSLPAFFTTAVPTGPNPWGAAAGEVSAAAVHERVSSATAPRAQAIWRHVLLPGCEEDFWACQRHWATLFDADRW
jgi:hypothetical protein